MHFFKLIGLKCLLAVPVHSHHITIKIHPVFFSFSMYRSPMVLLTPQLNLSRSHPNGGVDFPISPKHTPNGGVDFPISPKHTKFPSWLIINVSTCSQPRNDI